MKQGIGYRTVRGSGVVYLAALLVGTGALSIPAAAQDVADNGDPPGAESRPSHGEARSGEAAGRDSVTRYAQTREVGRADVGIVLAAATVAVIAVVFVANRNKPREQCDYSSCSESNTIFGRLGTIVP